MEKPLILIGGGGHCKSVIAAAESVGRRINGILDLPEFVGSECMGYKIIGTDNDIAKYVDECEFVVSLGFIKDASRRIELHNQVEKQGGKLATIIASSARVSIHAQIGEGTVVLHNACVNADSRIGKSCIINTLSNIEHDVEIGDFTHISTGAMINGNCTIGSATFIGSGVVVVNGKTVGNAITVGAGSVVCSDLIEKATYFGTPAKKH